MLTIDNNTYYKELIDDLIKSNSSSLTHVVKEDTRYKLTVVSTAAIPDRVEETFSIPAIDYDIKIAKETNIYPEFRVFHSPLLGIGMVDEMSRVGIFAIDSGYSYTDDFSLMVCKELEDNHDGRWRASRGFKALEVEMQCSECGKALIINKEHMVIGFRCPACERIHLSYKGMPHVNYTKTRTFDVTVTDVPAVPMTSVSAIAVYNQIDTIKDVPMNKDGLRKRLLDSGLDESIVDERLSGITDEQLKEYSDMPDAILKENLGAPEGSNDGEQTIVLDDEVIVAIADAAATRIKEVIEGAELELPEMEIEFPEFKEADYSSDIAELKEAVTLLDEKLSLLLQDDETRLKELNTPNNRRRLRVYKSTKKMSDEEDEEEDEEDGGKTVNGTKVTKEIARQLGKTSAADNGAIVDGSGNTYKSMTEFVTS